MDGKYSQELKKLYIYQQVSRQSTIIVYSEKDGSDARGAAIGGYGGQDAVEWEGVEWNPTVSVYHSDEYGNLEVYITTTDVNAQWILVVAVGQNTTLQIESLEASEYEAFVSAHKAEQAALRAMAEGEYIGDDQPF